MLKFGPDAVVSTIDPFISLKECLGKDGKVVRVRLRKFGATRETICSESRAKKLVAMLMPKQGEIYNCGSGWVATHETAKFLGYATIYVSIESPA